MNNEFLKNENLFRLSIGLGVAICAHIFVFGLISNFQTKNIIPADIFSPPTSVTVRFLNPITQPPKIVEVTPKPQPVKKQPIKKQSVKKDTVSKKKPLKKVEPKKIAQVAPSPIVSPQVASKILNNIEPAAAIPQAAQPIVKTLALATQQRPVPAIIPVISDTQIKGRRVQPKYPARAERMGQEGVVWLRVLISEAGKRQEIKIHKASQYALLNQAAVKAVKKWTFSPNIVGGTATKSWVEIPIEFKIQ